VEISAITLRANWKTLPIFLEMCADYQRQVAIRRASRSRRHHYFSGHVGSRRCDCCSACVRSLRTGISAVAAVPVSALPGSVSSPAITSLPLLFVLFALTALAAIGALAVYAAVHRK
jgi:hypothetical protein